MQSITEELRDYFFYDIEDDEICYALSDIADNIDDKYDKLLNNMNVARDMCGEPCCLDDVVYYKEEKFIVVAVSHKGKISIREFDKRDTGKGAVWVKASEVTHLIDSQEEIYKDMEELSVKYARMQLHDAYCIEIEIEKLLKRQQALDRKKYSDK